jgi:hypothetical protein
VLVLEDAAATDDGEDTSVSGLIGLHAKAYIAKDGWNTRLYLGSANASAAGLGRGKEGPTNVEILVELEGKTSRVGGVDEFLGEDGMSALLRPWERAALAEPDPDETAAQCSVDAARRAVAAAKLTLSFERDAELVTPTLSVATPLAVEGIGSLNVWLASMSDGNAVDALPLRDGLSVKLPACAVGSATSFVVVALTAERADISARFVVTVETKGLPDDRDAAIVRDIVQNEDRFLSYVLALLGMDRAPAPDEMVGVKWGSHAADSGAAEAGAGILERLIRAKSRDPQSLDDIRHIVADLLSTPAGEKMVPKAFRELWDVIAKEDA